MSSLTEVPVGSPPFRHEALFYAGDDEYLKGTVPYVEGGLASGEPVLVVVPQDRLELLREVLPTGNPLLQLADMEAIGRNPARIIPAWADFVLPLLAEGRTSRGIGEPIWPGRSAEELTECTWHETLINTAFGEAAGFSLLCPYDTTGLDPSVIEAAYSTHPLAGPPDGITPSSSYRTELPTCPDEPLSPIPEDATWLPFDEHGHPELRRMVRTAAVSVGLAPDTVDDVVLAVNEAVVNTVRHGGGIGRLCTWRDDGAFLCEVRDGGHIRDPLAGRRRPPVDRAGGRGLWLITQLSDLVQIRQLDDEQAIRIRISDTCR